MDRKYTRTQESYERGRKITETSSAGNQYSRVKTVGPTQVKTQNYKAPKSDTTKSTNTIKNQDKVITTKYTRTERTTNPPQTNSQLRSVPTTGVYKKTVNNISESLQKKNQDLVRGKKTKIGQTNDYNKNSRDTPKSKSQPKSNGDYNIKTKSVNRGDNVMITYVIYTRESDPEFHIIEQLDDEFASRPSQYESLRKSAKINRNKSAKSTFTDSCANWKPKEKGPSLCKSMVFQHAGGQSSSSDLQGSTEPYKNSVVRKNNTKPTKTVTRTRK